jgi:phosphoglycolate phosphatase-like HAD superfamily hydrolase
LQDARQVFSVLHQIRLLIFDLDYAIFDCALLKVQALRQSLISLADTIPQSVRLPDAADAEEGFHQHGFRWTRFLEIGLNEETLEHLQQAYRIHEDRLIESSVGRLYPGIEDFVANCRQANIGVAIGAESSRDYLVAVNDRHQLDSLFQFALCTEEFGVGDADEMFGEIMHQAEVNPSEVLALGTRPQFFQAAHNQDVLTIGCGWGIRRQDSLAEADLASPTLAQLFPAIQKADYLASQYSF